MSNVDLGPVEDPPTVWDRTEDMVLVEIDDDYTTWQTPEGEVVHYSTETGVELVPAEDLDIRVEWANYSATVPIFHTYGGFVEYLSALTFEPDDVEEFVGWCPDCATAVHEDDMSYTNEEDPDVCESCIDKYWLCYHCDERFKWTHTIGGNEVCPDCRDNKYSFCELCDEYYYSYDGGGCDGEHEGCDCEAPAQSFRVRNDGLAPLANDTRTTITLPAGEITDEGIGEMSTYLRKIADEQIDPDTGEYLPTRIAWWALACGLADLGSKWQTTDGNFPKRLSRLAYKKHQIKVPPEVLSNIGNIGSQHSQAADVHIEVTRDLNQSARDFGHTESCWWQSYYHGRCALKSNGGFGLRSFIGRSVSGRAWVMPLRFTGQHDDPSVTQAPSAVSGCVCAQCVPKPLTRAFEPTFDTIGADAFVVFNGYGSLSGYTAPRIVAHMAGLTYRKVAFTCEPMYVNGESGYLVAPESIASQYTDGSITLTVDQHANLFHAETIQTKEPVHA